MYDYEWFDTGEAHKFTRIYRIRTEHTESTAHTQLYLTIYQNEKKKPTTTQLLIDRSLIIRPNS